MGIVKDPLKNALKSVRDSESLRIRAMLHSCNAFAIVRARNVLIGKYDANMARRRS